MIEITEEEYKQFQALKKVWIHLNAERTHTYFICGETSGPKDSMGLPEHIVVCPIYGVNHTQLYKRVDR